MKILFQVDLNFKGKIYNLPENIYIELPSVPRIGEQVYLDEVIYTITNVIYNCPGIVCYFK